METYLSSLGFGVWKIFKDGYVVPATPLTNPPKIRAYENKGKAKHAIMSRLVDFDFVKVMQCKSTKEVWEKLSGIYEGDIRVKQS